MALDKKIVGKKIREIRIEKGLSQEELSEKIDISPRHMCTIENGNSLPSLETFIKITQVLDIDINNFFGIHVFKDESLRKQVCDLIQISSLSQLNLLKDIIVAVQKNKYN